MEKYTLQQCIDQRISIKTDTQEQRDLIAKNLKIKNGFFTERYIRVYHTRSDNRGPDSSSTTYKNIGIRNLSSDKEIHFNQLILNEMQDLNNPLRIVGKQKLIEAIIEDLREIGYGMTGGFAKNGITLRNQSIYKESLLDLVHTDEETVLSNFDSKIFNLPQDYVECLEFAKAQYEFLNKSKTLELNGITFELKDDTVFIKGKGLDTFRTKTTLLIILRDLFNVHIFGTYMVEEVKIGCTPFNRDDYNQLVEFLK